MKKIFLLIILTVIILAVLYFIGTRFAPQVFSPQQDGAQKPFQYPSKEIEELHVSATPQKQIGSSEVGRIQSINQGKTVLLIGSYTDPSSQSKAISVAQDSVVEFIVYEKDGKTWSFGKEIPAEDSPNLSRKPTDLVSLAVNQVIRYYLNDQGSISKIQILPVYQ